MTHTTDAVVRWSAGWTVKPIETAIDRKGKKVVAAGAAHRRTAAALRRTAAAAATAGQQLRTVARPSGRDDSCCGGRSCDGGGWRCGGRRLRQTAVAGQLLPCWMSREVEREVALATEACLPVGCRISRGCVSVRETGCPNQTKVLIKPSKTVQIQSAPDQYFYLGFGLETNHKPSNPTMNRAS